MKNEEKLRLLYLPLEDPPGGQVAPRAAFEKMLIHGRLQAYQAFPFLYEARQSRGWKGMLERLYTLASRFQPTAVFWELQTSGRVPKQFVRRLKALDSNPVIVQRTGDSYWKPPKNMVEFGREIDVTFLTGSSLIPEFQKAGCKDVRLLPERLDTVRLGKLWKRTGHPDFDVVMIANYYRQLWFRRFPGQIDRIKLVKAFSRKFGKRFGLFGKNWEGQPYWQGMVLYEKQQEPMRNSWLVLGVSNWDHSHYFSDRLLNSLASGVPVLYKHFPGAEDFFKDGIHCRFFYDVEEAVRIAGEVLDSPEEEREKMGRAGWEIAIKEHSTERRAEQLLDILERVREGQSVISRNHT